MKIALVGYGKMGQEIEQQINNREDEITVILTSKNNSENINQKLFITNIEQLLEIDFDVVIDFSNPDSALENLHFYAENDLKVVMGTTGWLGELEIIKTLFNNSKGAIIWSGNFSLGVIIYNKMVENFAQVMNKYNQYDISIHDIHHRGKKDSPSGTALQIGEILVESIDRKTGLELDRVDGTTINSNKIHVTSTRIGNVPGTHEVNFSSEYDSISLNHVAHGRGGFAVGSIESAHWLKDKEGYFEIDDFTKSL